MPAATRTAAIFDFDGTIIAGYSILAFLKERVRRRELGAADVARTAVSLNVVSMNVITPALKIVFRYPIKPQKVARRIGNIIPPLDKPGVFLKGKYSPSNVMVRCYRLVFIENIEPSVI